MAKEVVEIVKILEEHTKQIEAITLVTKQIIEKVIKLEVSKVIDDTLKAQANE
tara:strand:+ start:288 stop:446 length:159 start_codon:yes stop_codon:yes gene_type:complete